MNKKGCIGCARLVRVVNVGQPFCLLKTGVIYFVDDKWLKINDCEEKCKEILIKVD